MRRKAQRTLLSIMVKVMPYLLQNISSDLYDILLKFVKDFMDKCYATENKWDDILADLLAVLFDIDK